MIKMDEAELGFSIIIGFIIIGSIIALLSKDALFAEVLSGASIGMGTALLAYFTFRLTDATIKEGRQERRRQRIKEQLDILYSPLKAHTNELRDIRRHNVLRIKNMMEGIKMRYEYLATPELLEKFRDYYKYFPLHLVTIENWDSYIDEIINQVEKDYKILIDEYTSLTEPI